jgi:UDP-N-acetylmuramate dehydrogenase
MNLLAALFLKQLEGLTYHLNESLAPYTTFKIGGPADIMVFAKNEAEVLQVLQAAHQTQTPLFILGGGSNLLISDDGVRGCVLMLKGELAEIKVEDDNHKILVGAGTSFPKLTNTALKLGWENALGFCGTPGQVGGALIMNAGSRLGEIGEVVQEVYAATLSGLKVFQKHELQFGYRQTAFPENTVLTKTRLHCEEASPLRVSELLKKAEELAKKRKATQPKCRSAGSVFKNPPQDFAGRLIEATGLKGTQIGGAEISVTHANFIVNLKQAKAQDVFDLLQIMRQEVYRKFNILLEHEVKLVGTFISDKTENYDKTTQKK